MLWRCDLFGNNSIGKLSETRAQASRNLKQPQTLKFITMGAKRSRYLISNRDGHPIKQNSLRCAALSWIRAFCALVVILLLCSSFYYDSTVTRNLHKALYDSGHGEIFNRPLSTFSDIQIYPPKFQALYKRQKTEPIEPAGDPAKWTDEMRSEMRRKFQRHNRESIYSLMLFADDDEETTTPKFDTILQFGGFYDYIHELVRKRHLQHLYETHDIFGRDIKDEKRAVAHRENRAKLEAAWIGTKPRVIEDHNICHAFKHAKQIANFETPHVLITHLDENWGTLSSEVPGRTEDWGDIVRNMFVERDGFTCDAVEVLELYLNSPNTLAVFTTQHQALFDHPKVHSIPIGVSHSHHNGHQFLETLATQRRLARKHDPKKDSRPNLLMLNNSPTKTRKPQTEAVIRNFRKHGFELKNTYGATKEDYYKEMSESKFILCPSGIGWDAYRIWEALNMGVIPVIERHKYRYEVLMYPSGSGKRSKILRTLQKDETPGQAIDKKLMKHIKKHKATIDVIEYYDGWRKTFDDLPVLWIDGEFGESPPKDEKDSKGNYLTPDLLEQAYDAMAANMEKFKYEKLTSLYWMRLIESYLLLEDPSIAQKDADTPSDFSSFEEKHKWQAAMENLSPTYNNHTFYDKKQEWEGWQPEGWPLLPVKQEDPEDPVDVTHSSPEESPYLFGKLQPIILSWVIVIQLKLLGFAMIIFAWTKLTTSFQRKNSNEDKEILYP